MMESFAINKSFYDIVPGDELGDIWDSADLDPTMQDVLRLHSAGDLSGVEWSHHDDDDKDLPAVILHDKLMTDAAFSRTTVLRPIKTEHSYSMSSEGGGGDGGGGVNGPLPNSPRALRKDDMEDECFPAISMKKACGKLNETDDEMEADIEIKDEPISETDSLHSSCPPSPRTALTAADLHFNIDLKASKDLLKQSGLIIASGSEEQYFGQLPKLNVRIESGQTFQLPPTPPSCGGSSSDDSEDNVSTPHKRSAISTTARLLLNHHPAARQPIHTHLISSQPKGSTGNLVLTEEEKRTLIAEGYPVPTRLPLTKAEEKSLKKIRRKIKNKISAQESRRKKKEYMDQLERKVGILVSENNDYKKKIDDLQESNSTLMVQLQKLQSLIAKTYPQLSKRLEVV